MLRPKSTSSLLSDIVRHPDVRGDRMRRLASAQRDRESLQALADFLRDRPPPPSNYMSIPDAGDDSWGPGGATGAAGGAAGGNTPWGRINSVFRKAGGGGKTRGGGPGSGGRGGRYIRPTSRGQYHQQNHHQQQAPMQIRLPDSAVAGTTIGGHRHIAISIPIEFAHLGPTGSASHAASQYSTYTMPGTATTSQQQLQQYQQQRGFDARRVSARTSVTDRGVVTVLKPVVEDLEYLAPAVVVGGRPSGYMQTRTAPPSLHNAPLTNNSAGGGSPVPPMPMPHPPPSPDPAVTRQDFAKKHGGSSSSSAPQREASSEPGGWPVVVGAAAAALPRGSPLVVPRRLSGQQQLAGPSVVAGPSSPAPGSTAPSSQWLPHHAHASSFTFPSRRSSSRGAATSPLGDPLVMDSIDSVTRRWHERNASADTAQMARNVGGGGGAQGQDQGQGHAAARASISESIATSGSEPVVESADSARSYQANLSAVARAPQPLPATTLLPIPTTTTDQQQQRKTAGRISVGGTTEIAPLSAVGTGPSTPRAESPVDRGLGDNGEEDDRQYAGSLQSTPKALLGKKKSSRQERVRERKRRDVDARRAQVEGLQQHQQRGGSNEDDGGRGIEATAAAGDNDPFHDFSEGPDSNNNNNNSAAAVVATSGSASKRLSGMLSSSPILRRVRERLRSASASSDSSRGRRADSPHSSVVVGDGQTRTRSSPPHLTPVMVVADVKPDNFGTAVEAPLTTPRLKGAPARDDADVDVTPKNLAAAAAAVIATDIDPSPSKLASARSAAHSSQYATTSSGPTPPASLRSPSPDRRHHQLLDPATATATAGRDDASLGKGKGPAAAAALLLPSPDLPGGGDRSSTSSNLVPLDRTSLARRREWAAERERERAARRRATASAAVVDARSTRLAARRMLAEQAAAEALAVAATRALASAAAGGGGGRPGSAVGRTLRGGEGAVGGGGGGGARTRAHSGGSAMASAGGTVVLPRRELARRYEMLREAQTRDLERRLRRLERNSDLWLRAVVPLLERLEGTVDRVGDRVDDWWIRDRQRGEEEPGWDLRRQMAADGSGGGGRRASMKNLSVPAAPLPSTTRGSGIPPLPTAATRQTLRTHRSLPAAAHDYYHLDNDAPSPDSDADVFADAETELDFDAAAAAAGPSHQRQPSGSGAAAETTATAGRTTREGVARERLWEERYNRQRRARERQQAAEAAVAAGVAARLEEIERERAGLLLEQQQQRRRSQLSPLGGQRAQQGQGQGQVHETNMSLRGGGLAVEEDASGSSSGPERGEAGESVGGRSVGGRRAPRVQPPGDSDELAALGPLIREITVASRLSRETAGGKYNVLEDEEALIDLF